MKEIKFIQQNKRKWAEFEDLSKTEHKDSNLYSKLFIQITDDLSYARTFYSNRSVRVYLNNLAQDIFHKVFSRNKKKQSVIKDFWMEELPSIMYYHRTELLIAFLFTIGAVALGLLTYKYDSAFASKILGEGYLEMTAENIAKKDPMAVYKSMNSFEMFIKIVINNLRVDIQTFFSGLVVGIGSVLVLIYNGMMLAAFQFYFVKRGLFYESFLAVWLHGTLEISAMVICGAAGMVLGKGIVFPGTYSRMQSFFSASQRATKIFFAVLPITFIAAIIESFLTRYTNAPDALRLALIITSLLFIIGYFVYLPWLKKRNGTLRLIEAEKVLPESFAPFEFLQIKNISEIILDTFRLFRKYAGIFFNTIIWSSIIFMVIGITLNKQYLLEDIYYTQWSLINLKYFITADLNNWFTIFMPALLIYISLQICYVFYLERKILSNTAILTFYQWTLLNWEPVITHSFIQIMFYVLISVTTLEVYTFIFIIPLQFISTFSLFFPHKGQTNFISTFLKTLKSGLLNLFAINLAFLLLSIALFFLISTSVYWLIYEAITMNLTKEIISSDTVFLIFFLFAITAIVTMGFIFFCLYQGIFYFSQKEKHTAEGLKDQLENLGNKTRNYVQKK